MDKPQNVDEVFNSVSTILSSNLNPPPSSILLTPRSAQAVLTLGVNPEDLDSFWEPDIDPTIQRMRHEAYIQRRHDLIHMVRGERQKVINQEAEMVDAFASGGKSKLTAEDILKEQEAQGATLIENEKKRIQKLQRRQQKELESMLEYEIARAQREEEMKQKAEEEKRREEKKKRLKEKRMRQIAEERRLRELKKKAEEDAEEERRRIQAKRMFKRDQEIRRQRDREEKLRKRELMEREVEKRRKMEEHQLQIMRAQEEHDRELRLRIADMEQAEEKKMRQIEEKKRRHKIDMLRKRQDVERRIKKNLNAARDAEKKRKRDFLTKQAHHEHLRSTHLEKMDHDRMLATQQRYLNEQRRTMILEEHKREEENRKGHMLQMFDEREEVLEEVKRQRERERQINIERTNLRKQMKLENVNRVKRMGEYKRQQILVKIDDQDKRVLTMLEQKEALIKQRRESALATKIKKDKLMEMMGEVRTSNAKANKLIKSLVAGQSIEDLIHDGSNDGKRRKKGKKKRKKSKNSSSGLLNSSSGDFESQEVLGPRPDIESVKHMRTGESGEQISTPFISPYNDQPTPEEGQTITF